MLRRLALRDFVIVPGLEIELQGGFSVLTGETGAGKSILIDALQLVLGSRGDAGVVREGALRAEITAEFDLPPSLLAWLDEGGFVQGETLLLRRVIDAQGKSRAWINGSAATTAQLRTAADHLVEIHGQHAWQSLTRSASVRALLDTYAELDTVLLNERWTRLKEADHVLEQARTRQAELASEGERLAWQIAEVDKLNPGLDEWHELNGEHQRLSNAQALMDATRAALDAVSAAETNADSLCGEAIDALHKVAGFDARLVEMAEVLQSAQTQLQDAAHSLSGYLHHADLDPARLNELDERLSSWIGLARRYRLAPAEVPARLATWKQECMEIDVAADLVGLQAALSQAKMAFDQEAHRVSAVRHAAAPKLSAAITKAMQPLGMAGGCFEVRLVAQECPQSFGYESVEFLVSGHAGTTPRPLPKVASGGELSRIALAVAVTTSRLVSSNEYGGLAAGTLIFDEIDSGIGGTVADTVGRLLKELGRGCQVMAVTHLPQVAACADHHFVVSKATFNGVTSSGVDAVSHEARVAEISRMLGGEKMSDTSLAHAHKLLMVSSGPSGTAAQRTRKRA